MPELIGLISDAHGNGPAFDKGFQLLRAQGATRIFFLGDAVGYIPSITVLESIARLGMDIECIQGNHEAMLLGNSLDLARDEVYQLAQVRRDMRPEIAKMISAWPTLRLERVDGIQMLLVHGSPTDPTYGYVYPDTDLSSFTPVADVVFMGHTHHPFVREHAGRLYVNIGSCGLPRDHGGLGSVALFDTAARQARILRYDITSESRAALQQATSTHTSVRQVFERQRLHVVGDVLC